MFHLFKKVYLDWDDKIDAHCDRIIISSKYGGAYEDPHNYYKLYGSEKSINNLLGKNKKYLNFAELLYEINNKNTDEKTIIYCDREAYYKLAIKWLKAILPNCDSKSAWLFFKSHLFKEKNFVNSRLSATQGFVQNADEWILDEVSFLVYWDQEIENRALYKKLIGAVKENLRIEFLLASYLLDKRHSHSFAMALTPLVRKNIEVFLYEHKEIILVNFQNPLFQKLLKLKNGPYTFENFYDIVYDKAPMAEIMFRSDIWGETKSTIRSASSKKTINISAFTDEDIETLKKYSQVCGAVWSDNQIYTIVNSEIDKFDFIKMFRNKDFLTIKDVDEIIKYELYHQYHSAGIFYSISTETVNTYFVDFILQNHTNKDILLKYAVGE